MSAGQVPMTLPALLRRNAQALPGKPAIVTRETSITHGALDSESRLLASRLVGAGVRKASRVGLLMPNGPAWAVTAAAVARTGAVLVPLSTLLRPPELLRQLVTADVSHLISVRSFRGRAYLDELGSAAHGLLDRTERGERHIDLPLLESVWTPDAIPSAAVGTAVVDAIEAAVRPADDLVVLFTSGSRGDPKGSIHTHSGAIRATESGLASRCISPDDRLYIPMPFFWTGGYAGGLLTAIVAGATLLTEEVPDPARTLELLSRERVTLFRGWPDQAVRLARDERFAAADLSSLRDASLPAVLPPERRPAEGARPNLFGMTETFGPWCGDRLDRDLPAEARGSCGRPFEGFEVRIVDPATRRPLPPGLPGEVLLRGPALMRGICGQVREETFDADGYYATGDLGTLDRNGWFWYGGRLDDMFKVHGATVYPAEVESALRGVEGVRQAFVTDVPTDAAGPAVGALVIADVPLPEVAAAVRQRLSAFKVPGVWICTPDADVVPMSATGKVDVAALRDLIGRRGAAVG